MSYRNVVFVNEMRDGVLLVMSKKRFLFLPTTDEAEHNKRLVDILVLITKYVYHVVREEKLSGSGITHSKWFARYVYRNRLHKDKFFRISLAVLAIMSIFVGSVFVYELPSNVMIPREDAVEITGAFENYQRYYRGRNSTYLSIDLYGHERKFVSNASTTDALISKLEEIPENTEMTLLLHPKSDNVLEIEVDDEILLEFDYALERNRNNAIGFFVLGLFMYTAAIVFLIKAFRKRL